MAYLGNPTITPKDLYAADATSLLSKKSLDFSSKTYKNAQDQYSDMKPMWIYSLLSLAFTYMDLPEYITTFLSYDEKLYLRQGVLHVEQGHLYPQVYTGYGEDDGSYAKPESELVVKRQEYPTTYMEEAGKDPIHLVAMVDQRLFDHAERWYDFSNYTATLEQYVSSLTKSINISLICNFSAAILGFTGRMVFLERGSELERFFQPTGKDVIPSDNESKNAKEFYSGKQKEVVKKIAGEAMVKMKNIISYDPTTPTTEWKLVARNQQLSEVMKRDKKDLEDLSKFKTYAKKAYLKEDGGKFKMIDASRRECLIGMATALNTHLTAASTSPKYKYMMQFDPYATSRNDPQQKGMLRENETVILMNSYDLEDMQDLTGSPVHSPLTDIYNGTIQKWRSRGMQILGVEMISPGWAICLDKEAFKIVYYFDKVYKEFFPLQLVTTWIRHYYLRVIIFKNFPGFVLAPTKFHPNQEWIVDHLEEITK